MIPSAERTSDVRKPAVAGMFYPGDPTELRSMISRMIDAAGQVSIPGNILALISPHAGYPYSGPTAAHAYALLQSVEFDVVVTVGPSHRDYFEGVSIYPGKAYRTPLGEIEIDQEIQDKLQRLGLATSNLGHRGEHSVEVQLPFLQCVRKDFRFVPLVMGTQTEGSCVQLGDALASALEGRKAVIIASSDLSHFHPQQEANTLDGRVLKTVTAFDESALLSQLEMDEVEACGGGPIVAVMRAAKKLGATDARVLHYATSGDVTGDTESVVGYMSAAIYRKN